MSIHSPRPQNTRAGRLSARAARLAPVILGLAALSCGQPLPEPAADPLASTRHAALPHAERHSALSNAGRYQVSWRPVGGEIVLHQWFTIQVDVSDVALRGPVPDDVGLNVVGGMSAHGHGMNRIPLVTRTGRGSFLVEGLFFHMPGVWELYFDLTRSGYTERAQFEIEML